MLLVLATMQVVLLCAMVALCQLETTSMCPIPAAQAVPTVKPHGIVASFVPKTMPPPEGCFPAPGAEVLLLLDITTPQRVPQPLAGVTSQAQTHMGLSMRLAMVCVCPWTQIPAMLLH